MQIKDKLCMSRIFLWQWLSRSSNSPHLMSFHTDTIPLNDCHGCHGDGDQNKWRLNVSEMKLYSPGSCPLFQTCNFHSRRIYGKPFWPLFRMTWPRRLHGWRTPMVAIPTCRPCLIGLKIATIPTPRPPTHNNKRQPVRSWLDIVTYCWWSVRCINLVKVLWHVFSILLIMILLLYDIHYLWTLELSVRHLKGVSNSP